MTLYRKIFILVFLTLSVALLVAGVTIYRSVSTFTLDRYVDRYKKTNLFIGQTLLQMEKVTEYVGQNALNYLQDLEDRDGLGSDEELSKLASELKVSHFYAIDSRGKFIRNTDIPIDENTKNLFEFCEGYRDLLTGKSKIAQTPIIPSFPNTKPFKFVMVANRSKTRILEVGIHLDFIANTLQGILQGDSETIALGLYTPSGSNLGFLSQAANFQYNTTPLTIEETRETVFVDRDQRELKITSRVPASYESCCECASKGILLDDGRYYYVLQSTVSLNSYLKAVERLKAILTIMMVIGFAIAAILARWLSKNLTSKIASISGAANEIIATGDLSKRVDVGGRDEISELAVNFNNMIDSLADSREKLVESEKDRYLNQLATQVAHDIRSPISALQIALDSPEADSESKKVLIKAALNRIKDISNNLLKAYQSSKAPEIEKECCHLPFIVETILLEKHTQTSSNEFIIEGMDEYGLDFFALFNAGELKRILSNLIDNATKFNFKHKPIRIIFSKIAKFTTITVSDQGGGIPIDQLNKIRRGETTRNRDGHGLGISGAIRTVSLLGGKFEINSEVGVGTEVTLTLPSCEPPDWFVGLLELSKGAKVFVVDDDPSVHEIWSRRFKDLPVNVEHFDQIDEESKSKLKQAAQDSNSAIKMLLLCDYEFLGKQKNGIDFITELNLEDRAILVTHHYENQEVKDRCSKERIRLLSKLLVQRIEIVING